MHLLEFLLVKNLVWCLICQVFVLRRVDPQVARDGIFRALLLLLISWNPHIAIFLQALEFAVIWTVQCCNSYELAFPLVRTDAFSTVIINCLSILILRLKSKIALSWEVTCHWKFFLGQQVSRWNACVLYFFVEVCFIIWLVHGDLDSSLGPWAKFSFPIARHCITHHRLLFCLRIGCCFRHWLLVVNFHWAARSNTLPCDRLLATAMPLLFNWLQVGKREFARVLMRILWHVPKAWLEILFIF